MKISFVSIIAFLSLSLGAFAVPLVEASLEKRAPIDDAYTIVKTLYADIKTHTGAINATAARLSPKSSYKEKRLAATHVGNQMHDITVAVKKAAFKVAHLNTCSTPAVSIRQVPTGPEALAALLVAILLEIGGALNGIIAALGLQPLLSFLIPLVASLSALLLSLEVVVNNLLALVQALVDGLLTGLSLALAGLVL